ncbi:MAG: hypothetical protein KF709_05385 [Gemmatimonadaceae bacterium]|nr:hypothetical protein [Gemmatimonadaceae bacterium]
MSTATQVEPGYIALEGGDSRVEVVPTDGVLVRSLHLFGREWLLQPSVARAAARAQGVHPTSDFGWIECAPVAGGGTVPSWVKGIGGQQFKPGGELRSRMPELALATDDEGHKLTSTWLGARAPWMLSRTLLVRPDGAVEARYEARATGRDRLPFLWSLWLSLPLTSDTRLRLPDTARMRVSQAEGCAIPSERADRPTRWPQLTVDEKARDLSVPASLPRSARLQAWVATSSARSQFQVIEDDSRLSIATDGAGVPFVGVHVDRPGLGRARRGGLRRRGVPALTLAFSLGAPDTYAQALGDWQSITWLVPGEPRRWTITIRGGAA